MIRHKTGFFHGYYAARLCCSESPLRRIATAVILAALAISNSAYAQVSTFDSQGNIYIGASPSAGGETITPGAFQSNFVVATCYVQGGTSLFGGGTPPVPCTHGYVSKLTPDGSKVLVGTYLGGNSGDTISAIAVDSSGNIYIAGSTSSTDFPVTSDAYQKTPGPCFLSVLSADGTKLLHSTYLNTSGFDGLGSLAGIAGIAVDAQARVLVAGTISTPYPAYAQQPFLVAVSPQLSQIEYAVGSGAFFAGPFGYLQSAGTVNALALDSSFNVYVSGYPLTANNTGNLFVTKLNSAGTELWTFTFGNANTDTLYTLSVDAAGEAFIVGQTESTNFPVTTGAYQPSEYYEPTQSFAEGFAVKVSADGSHMVYSALLGLGPPTEAERAPVHYLVPPVLAGIDSAGDLMMAGQFGISVANFPATSDAMMPCLNAAESQFGADVFLKLAPDGSHLLYATVLPQTVPTNLTPSYLVGLESNGKLVVSNQPNLFDVIDTTLPTPQSVTCVANAASFIAGAIAPGEVVSIFGPSIGPAAAVGMQSVNGVVSSSLAGIEVTIGGFPAPLLYASQDQINAVVPFEVAGMTQASVAVTNQGVKLPAVTVPVTATAAGIFTFDSSGAGQAAAFNQDGTINSSQNPAAPGSTVTVFVTGAGQMQPSVKDGSLGNGKTTPVLPISGFLDTAALSTTRVGDAPGLVEGIVQVSFVVPESLGTVHSLQIWFGSQDPYGSQNPNLAAQANVFVNAQ